MAKLFFKIVNVLWKFLVDGKNLRTTQIQKEMYSATISLPREECCPYFGDYFYLISTYIYVCVSINVGLGLFTVFLTCF